MLKSLLLLSLLGLTTASVAARSLDPSEALSRALSGSSVSRSAQVMVKQTPVMTVGKSASPVLYVFEAEEGGYLVVSADDVAVPLLGYSSGEKFDAENMPENMRWWLSQYQTEIEHAVKNGVESFDGRSSRTERAAIAPLLTTRWNQSAPYNNLCPTDENMQQCVTGCVATSMAQVVNYHEWPATLKDPVFEYAWGDHGYNLRWTFKGEFDYANMLDDYKSNNYDDVQATAVAQLMKACGYAVSMDYSPSASGAFTFNIPTALINHFDYDSGAYLAYRDYFSLSEWEDLIYNDLKTCGPVIYGGDNASAGHSFVCDGYQGDGFFHINWGWGGVSDGYFRLSALDPDSQGIGGSMSGYNMGQDAVIGLKRPSADSKPKQEVTCVNTLNATFDAMANSITLSGDFINYYNEVDFYFGVRLTDESGATVKDIFNARLYSLPAPKSNGSMTYFPKYTIPSVGVPEGTYRMYPIIKLADGSIQSIPVTADQEPFLSLTRTGDDISIVKPVRGVFSVTDLEFKTPLFLGRSYSISGKASWTGDISVTNPIMGVFMTESSLETAIYADVAMAHEFGPDGEVLEFEYVGNGLTTDMGLVPGTTYYFAMAVYDSTNESGVRLISDIVPIELKANVGNAVVSSIFSIEDVNNVNPDNIVANVALSCKSGYFYDSVVVVFANMSGAVFSSFYSEKISLEAGQNANVKVIGNISGAKPGDEYLTALFINNQQAGNAYKITIGDYSGIADVIADGVVGVVASPNPAVDYTIITAGSEISRVDLIALSGSVVSTAAEINGSEARVDVSTLAPGIYLARVVTATGVETVKIVKK